MLVTIKGHRKVIVYEQIIAPHLTVCLSVLSSLFVKDNAPDRVHQQYLSVFAWREGMGVVSLPFSPQQSPSHPSIMHLMKGYHAEPFLKHSGKQNNLCSPREKCSSCWVSVIILLWKGSRGWYPHLTTMIQLSVTNHWSPCQKQGHSVPHYSFLLYCVMHHPWKGDLMDTRPTVLKSQANTLYLLSFREISIIKAASCL